jgi:hypothetical protein
LRFAGCTTRTCARAPIGVTGCRARPARGAGLVEHVPLGQYLAVISLCDTITLTGTREVSGKWARGRASVAGGKERVLSACASRDGAIDRCMRALPPRAAHARLRGQAQRWPCCVAVCHRHAALSVAVFWSICRSPGCMARTGGRYTMKRSLAGLVQRGSSFAFEFINLDLTYQ